MNNLKIHIENYGEYPLCPPGRCPMR